MANKAPHMCLLDRVRRKVIHLIRKIFTMQALKQKSFSWKVQQIHSDLLGDLVSHKPRKLANFIR